jgi:tagatose-1,6-bisphosphate aldolase
MSTSLLCDQNGFIKIVALDHRDSLKKILPENEIVEFKSLCVEAFGPFVTAVLLDPEYLGKIGIGAVPQKGHYSTIAVPFLASLEKSGYLDTSDGRVTEVYGDYFDATVAKRIGAVATKILVYFNSEAPSRNRQVVVAKKAYEESQQANIPLLLEIVTYPFKNKVYSESLEISRALSLLSDYGDVLKLNYCDDLETLSELNHLGKPWVLLSRGKPFVEYKKLLVKAKEIGGATGFAVGRALWQEIGDLKSWKKKGDFIKDTAVSRLKELVEIFK